MLDKLLTEVTNTTRSGRVRHTESRNSVRGWGSLMPRRCYLLSLKQTSCSEDKRRLVLKRLWRASPHRDKISQSCLSRTPRADDRYKACVKRDDPWAKPSLIGDRDAVYTSVFTSIWA